MCKRCLLPQMSHLAYRKVVLVEYVVQNKKNILKQLTTKSHEILQDFVKKVIDVFCNLSLGEALKIFLMTLMTFINDINAEISFEVRTMT